MCKFVIAKQFDVTLNRAAAQDLLFRVQIQRILRVDVEHGRIGGFLMSPVAELHDEQQASHRIELFGRPPHLRIEVFRQLACWHQRQNGLPKDMLPAIGESHDKRRAQECRQRHGTVHFIEDLPDTARRRSLRRIAAER